MNDEALLLTAAFLRRLIFSSGDVSNVPRPVVVLSVNGDELRVLEQGYLRAEVRTQMRDEFYQDTVPDLSRTRFAAAREIHKTVSSWLASTEEARRELAALLRQGEIPLKKPKPKPAAPADKRPPGVWIDAQRRTCIRAAFATDDEVATFIPMEEGEGFEVVHQPVTEFVKRYSPLDDYPVDRAAQLFLSYALSAGATEAAMKLLGGIIDITAKEIEMATSKKAASAAKKGAAPAAKKGAAAKTAKGAKAKTNGEAKPRAPRGETPASMFQALIREGKLTDSDIFAKVQAKFGLDDKKRSYVAWYRNYLTKKGEKVPGPVTSA